MFKISNIFSKQNVEQSQDKTDNNKDNILKVTQNWYEERSDNITVQRNLLMVLLIILTVFMVVATLVIAFVVKSKQFDPFVIQLDDNTGRTSVVNPVSSSLLIADDSLTRFFIKKYVIARESYNPVDFDTTARTTVRLLSTSGVYYGYLGYIRNKDIDPTLKYKKDNTTFVIIKSWSKLEEKKYLVRFSINEAAGDRKVFSKIAVVSYNYMPMELTEAERDVNPVGFQVNGYRVDDDNS